MSTADRDALVVVDMQNLFVDLVEQNDGRGGDVVREVNARVDDFARRDRPVFFTRDVAPIDFPPGDPQGITKLHDGLDRRGTVVEKGPGSKGGFSGFVLESQHLGGGGLSELASLLRTTGASEVVVVGIAADVCVSATAMDARRLGYDVTVPLSASAFVHAHPDGDDAAIAELEAAGVTVVRA